MHLTLTDPQRRTLEQLIGTGPRPTFPSDLAQRLRDRIEEAVRGLDLREQLWLGKERLSNHDRCEGMFASDVAGESTPFVHSAKSAGGVLSHKAIEVDMASTEPLDPITAAEVAVARLTNREERFAEHWASLTDPDRDEALMEAARRLTLLRASLPPLRTLRRQLAPVTEFRARAELLGGALVLSGQIDLLLGLADELEPNRGTKLAVDFKSGDARPEHAEDMRFYALVLTLRFGVPPYRVASLFLESGEWQAEDVGEEMLGRAVDRVIATARSAGAVAGGRSPSLTPGPWCGWCPRGERCPSFDPTAGRRQADATA